MVIDLRVLQKFLCFVDNGPKRYKGIFDVTVFQQEGDMRLLSDHRGAPETNPHSAALI